MLRIFNVALVVVVIGCSFVLYSLEHASRKTERRIAELKQNIINERDTIKLLNAEWSLLTRPARLERLAREHLKLQQMRPEQLVSQADIGKRLPERSVLAPGDDGDAIGNMLKGLE